MVNVPGDWHLTIRISKAFSEVDESKFDTSSMKVKIL